MINSLFADVSSAGAVVLVAVTAVVSIVGSYLFLRANPNKKAVIDRKVNEISNEIKR